MAVEKVAATGFTFAINTGTVAVPIWTAIGGIETWSISRSQSDADTTDIDSAGDEEHLPIRRGRELSLEGHYLIDPADGTRDAGQDAVDTLAEGVGSAGIKQFRITLPGGGTVTQSASARTDGPNGSKSDVAKWSATLKFTGARTVA